MLLYYNTYNSIVSYVKVQTITEGNIFRFRVLDDGKREEKEILEADRTLASDVRVLGSRLFFR